MNSKLRNKTQRVTDRKKLARAHLYARASQLFSLTLKPKGWAVVLAGKEAEEVSPLRYLLSWDPSKVLFVDDTEKQGLRKAKKLWPNANIYFGDLRDAIEYRIKDEPIGFANLDFMGHWGPDEQESLEIVGERLSEGSFLAYTYARRGNEKDLTNSYVARLRSLIRKYDLPDTKDTLRILFYEDKIKHSAKKPLELAGSVMYRRFTHGICMGSLYFHYLKAQHRTPEWREDLVKPQNFLRLDTNSTPPLQI